ncbi:DinB family protein [Paenibacillus nanensis]|uniref:DinB family protein n=1 Tax=Paenibacillus nanensis TaxID=393251 RepID=A0A3A1UYW2_9BACL|nr:DinB family protein [Paenibacillus nanensis]RIX53678.1 DinB family protein [Paenibacillus nanensis]
MDLAQRKQWNEGHKCLTDIILKPQEHDSAVKLFLQQHAWLHSSKLTPSGSVRTLEDELLDGAKEETLRQYPVRTPDTKNSIVWHLWHIARIEDMTMNVLVGNHEQILYAGGWYRKLNIGVEHSGNGMSEAEIANLSSGINISALLTYRTEVGRRTRDIISSLEPRQFKQKVEPHQISKLEELGAVKKGEKWLLEYWGNKTIAGLALMPATRHNFVHLNKSLRIKQKLQKNKA